METKKKSYDDDDKIIDFAKLEKELESAVEADARYWRENDAKFRAVHQKVASYDEFRDIVKASHLKPLEQDDRLTNVKFTQPWNSSCTKKENTANKPDHENLPKEKEYPTTSQTFIREWRKLNKDMSLQYQYLIGMGGDRLGQIFKPEIGFGLLGEFACCLDCEFNKENKDNVLEILVKLSETNRFKLTVDFLSKKEKGYIISLFEKLTSCVNDDDDNVAVFDNLKSVYGIEK
ncbi:hypothetical protein ACF0H5_019855 [Mactra antiquata]